MKKIIIATLAIVLVVASVYYIGAVSPIPELFHDRFFPDKTIEETGNCGEDATWTFNKSKGELVISGTGSFGSSKEFSDCTIIRSVVIEQGITEIGECAFSGCAYLKNVSLPDSLKKIDNDAFSSCERLENITISKNVTEIEEPFLFCDVLSGKLTSICVDPENKNYSSDENGVLYNKDKTVLIRYPLGNKRSEFVVPDGVKTIVDGAFNGARKLISITLADSVQDIQDNAFHSCPALEAISLGKNVKTIGYYAFGGCGSLKSLKLPDGVTEIGNQAFSVCDSLGSLTIPTSVKRIGYEILQLSGKPDIYYAGTKEQWDKIEKEDNTVFEKTEIHYNSNPDEN